MRISTTKMTARQYLTLGEDPLGVRLELVCGQVAVHPGQTAVHSLIEMALLYALSDRIEAERGHLFLNMDVVFGEYDVRRVDLLYFSGPRAHLVQRDKAISDPPDLCIEIISDVSRDIDRIDKFRQYADGGVRYYWVVDPDEQTLDAFQLVKGEYQLVKRGSGGETTKVPPFLNVNLELASLWSWGER